MADLPNETPDAPEDDTPVVPDALLDASVVIDLDPELAAVLDASVDDVLGDLGSVDDIVGDPSEVLEALDAGTPGPEGREAVARTAPKQAPRRSPSGVPGGAVGRIDVSAHAHESSPTPAERIALLVMPVLVIAAFAAVALLVL